MLLSRCYISICIVAPHERIQVQFYLPDTAPHRHHHHHHHHSDSGGGSSVTPSRGSRSRSRSSSKERLLSKLADSAAVVDTPVDEDDVKGERHSAAQSQSAPRSFTFR